MRKVVIITAIFSATVLAFNTAHAEVSDTVQAIECSISDEYIGLNSTKYIKIDDSYAPIEKRHGRVYINYSETECEDKTELTFKSGDFKELEKGETVYARMNHYSPDLKVSGTVRCRKVNLRE